MSLVTVEIDELQFSTLQSIMMETRDRLRDANTTIHKLDVTIMQLHDWVQYSSCILLMVFFAVMMISTVYMFGIGKLWRGKE